VARLLNAVLPLVLLVCWSGTASAAKFIITVKGVNGKEDDVTDAEILVYTGNGFLVNKGEVTYDSARKVYIVEIDEPRLTAAGVSTVTLEVRAPKRASVKLELLLGKYDQVIAVALPLMTTYTGQVVYGCQPFCQPPACPTGRHRFCHKH